VFLSRKSFACRLESSTVTPLLIVSFRPPLNQGDDVRAAVTNLDDGEGVLGELRASAKTENKETILRDAARLSKPKSE
jgi:hypothetical protein